MLVIFINVYKGRGCGDLAANIGPINENPSPIQFLINPLYYTNNLLTAQRNLYLNSLEHLVPPQLGGCEQSHVAGRTYSGRLEDFQRSL